jgi:hypothetical protein
MTDRQQVKQRRTFSLEDEAKRAEAWQACFFRLGLVRRWRRQPRNVHVCAVATTHGKVFLAVPKTRSVRVTLQQHASLFFPPGSECGVAEASSVQFSVPFAAQCSPWRHINAPRSTMMHAYLSRWVPRTPHPAPPCLIDLSKSGCGMLLS